MLKFFYKIEKLWSKIPIRKVRSLFWTVSKPLINYICKYHFKYFPVKNVNTCQSLIDGEVILSMTTFPSRLTTINLVLESLFRQTVMPNRFILWLAENQFPDKKVVDEFFSRYKNLGLEIEYCDDLRAHKKYYYTMKKYPNAYVVTVDDDILYPEDMLEKLLRTYVKYPRCIVTNRAHEIKLNDCGELKPYNAWNWLAKGTRGPSLSLFATGGAGCLYFPNSLSKHVFDKNICIKYCLNADDVWLKCMSFINGTEVVITGIDNPEIIDVVGNKDNGLAKQNVSDGNNDNQLVAVSKYYGIDWSKCYENSRRD